MRRKMSFASMMVAALLTLVACVGARPALAAGTQTMYRLYNPWSGEHLFTADAGEYSSLASIGWSQEGEAWQAPASGHDVYRLYNPYSGDHFYTGDANEYASLAAQGWRQEGVSFHSVSAPGDASQGHAIYRLFNSWLQAGTHLFTSDAGEYYTLIGQGWQGEEVAFTAESVPAKTTAQLRQERRMQLALDFVRDYISNTNDPTDASSGVLSSSAWVSRVRGYLSPSTRRVISSQNYQSDPQTVHNVHMISIIDGNVYGVSYDYVDGAYSGTAELWPAFDSDDLIYAWQ